MKKQQTSSASDDATCSDLVEAARQAIKNTDWDAYWRKVDAAVAVACDACREARRKSMEEMGSRVLRDPNDQAMAPPPQRLPSTKDVPGG
jgi:hypothetical protein